MPTTRRRSDVGGERPPTKRSRRAAAPDAPPFAPTPLPPALSPALDTQMFPHLLDHIVDVAGYHSLVALRAVSHALRARADERLSERVVVRAPASKRTPGLYIYTLAPRSPTTTPHDSNDDDEPLPIPGFAFYPFASDRPYTYRIAAQEDAWTSAQGGREEYGDDHWAWNYSSGEWERVWRAWGVRPPTALPDGERGLRVVGDAEPAPELSDAAPPLVRPNFVREMREAEIARAYKWCARACAAVRAIDVVGPVGREAQRLFHGMRGVRTLRIEGSGREMVATVPVPAPHVHVNLSFARPRPDAPAQERVPHAMVPRLIEGVRTLTLHVTVERVGDGGTPYGVILPFSHPYSLREVVVVLRPGPPSAGPCIEGTQRFGMLDAVLDQAMPRLDHVAHTIVGLDPYTYPALGGAPPSAQSGVDDTAAAYGERGRRALDEQTAEAKANFLRRLERRVRERAGVSAQFGRPWSEERVEAVIAGVRLPSLHEWDGQAKGAAGPE